MNPIARVERVCARFVEDAFARVFPSELEPAQVARKLVAVMQATPGELYLVRVHPADYARFDADRDFLEARWSALLREALPAARSPETPRALLHEDARVVAGSVVIEAVSDDRGATYLLERADGRQILLRDGLRLGRAPDNDVVLADRRVSRRHARIAADDAAAAAGFFIEDLGSSNGTFVDGRRVTRAPLDRGATITLGDTQLTVVHHVAG